MGLREKKRKKIGYWRCLNKKLDLNLKLATWNCLSLGKTEAEREGKLAFCRELGYDVLCLTELWNQQSDREDFVVSDINRTDRAAGVGLLFSKRILPFVKRTGSCGARIVWARINGPTCNLVLVGVYLPHAGKKSQPHAEHVLLKLCEFLEGLGRHECVVILGDLNAQLPRNVEGITGRWTWSIDGDNRNAPKVLSVMRRFGLVAMNSLFQPPRGHSVATWQRPSLRALRLAAQGGSPKGRTIRSRPKQIDYILCSSRWKSCITDAKVSWQPSLLLHGKGTKWDHALVEATWRWRIRSHKPPRRRNLRILRDSTNPVAKIFNDTTADWLQNCGFEHASGAEERYSCLVACWQAVRWIMPPTEAKTRKNSMMSAKTKQLLEKRAILKGRRGGIPARWAHELDRLVQRAVRRDRRNFQSRLVADACAAEERNDKGEASRLVRILRQKPRKAHWQRQPTRKLDGSAIISDADLAQAWTTFRSEQFKQRDGAFEFPDIEAAFAGEDGAEVPFPDADWILAVDRIKFDKAVGWDRIPGEIFKVSPAWRNAAKRVAEDIWAEEAVPEDMLLAIMRNLLKLLRDAEIFSNYRPVCLLTSMYKLFATMLYLRTLREVQASVSKWHAGFQRKRGYVDNSVVLMELLRYCLEMGLKLLVVFTDINQAFDSFDHGAVIWSLIEAGASRKSVVLIADIYSKAKAVVMAGRAVGTPFRIGRGVLEGDILSPLLFIVGLEYVFREAGDDACAPRIGNIPVPQLGFADDVIMLSTGNINSVQERVDSVDTSLGRRGLQFSRKEGKCKLMHGGPALSTPKPTSADIENLKLKFKCKFCGARRFVNLAGKKRHEASCDLRCTTHPGRFDVESILDVRGPPDARFYKVNWAPGQRGPLVTWEPSRHLGDFCNGAILDWFSANPQWHILDDVEVEGEVRCPRCNRRDFKSKRGLAIHMRCMHTPPVISGTLAFKRAKLVLQQKAHDQLPKLRLGDCDVDNCWMTTWLGSLHRGDGRQEELVDRQLGVMLGKFHELRHLLTDKHKKLKWRMQWYVTGVVATALHNVGGWLFDQRTQRRLNGTNARLLSKITGKSVHQEARSPHFCAVQWARVKRAKWLGHILREDELSLVKAAVLQSYARGEVGTLMDEAPPHRDINHLCALAAKPNNFWEGWCAQMARTICPEKYEGLACREIRKSLRVGGRQPYDPVPPDVIVPPPISLGGVAAPRARRTGNRNLVRDLVAEALAEVNGREVEDRSRPMDIYVDGSCFDNGRPWAAAGWGVCVHNSVDLGEFHRTLPVNCQTNNRAELMALVVALRLAWHSGRSHTRIYPDSNLACRGVSNRDDEWAWRAALGMDGWLARWERQGWRSANGKRVSHSDLWRLILSWLRRFADAPGRRVEVRHVRAHEGNAGNERADKLAKLGAKVRFDMMVKGSPTNWNERAKKLYWGNRR